MLSNMSEQFGDHIVCSNRSSIITPDHNETEFKFNMYENSVVSDETMIIYKAVVYLIGTVIIVSNLSVVVSSGLILKKGQQPKSTYLLLGNMSLADTIVGVAAILIDVGDKPNNSNPICIFQMGLIVCTAIISVLSVTTIAVDRYIYILHGLYYQRRVNTTRVRICITFMWFTGMMVGFLPAMGLYNRELLCTDCAYVALFPNYLIIVHFIIVVTPIIIVCILYSIILVKALKTGRKLRLEAKKRKLREAQLQNRAAAQISISKTSQTSDLGFRSASSNAVTDNTSIDRVVEPARCHSNDNIINSSNKARSFHKISRTATFNTVDDFTARGIKLVKSNDDNANNTNEHHGKIQKNEKLFRSLSFNVGEKNTRRNGYPKFSQKDDDSNDQTNPDSYDRHIHSDNNVPIADTAKPDSINSTTNVNANCFKTEESQKLFKSVSFNTVNQTNVEDKELATYASNDGAANNFTNTNNLNKGSQESKITHSVLSVETLQTNISNRNNSSTDVQRIQTSNDKTNNALINSTATRKVRESSKWRAISIVMLTTGSFVATWIPFFITVIFFVSCENKLTNPECMYYRVLIVRIIGVLVYVNSIMNPLIYAWWHKGFKKSVKMYYRRYIRYMCQNDR